MVRSILLLATPFTLLAGAALAQPRPWAPPSPAQGSVTIYEHANFQGRSATFYGDVGWLPEGISSLRVQGVSVTVFRGPGFAGPSQTFYHDVPNLAYSGVGNDAVRSLRLGPPGQAGPPPAEGPAVILYQHANFQGRSQTFRGDVANLAGSFIGNDQASSIRVINAVATLYEHANFQGRHQTFDYDVSDLRTTFIGGDSVSSLRVFPRGPLRPEPPAPSQPIRVEPSGE